MKIKKLISSLLCGIILISSLSACSNDSKNESGNLDDNKTITIGCEATTPGWIQSSKNGNLSGYDYDVWQEIGKRTGYKIDYKVMEWDSLWSMLEQGRIDSVGEQISVSPERKEKYYFSDPYGYNVYCLLAAKDNKELNSMDDLKTGMTISCETNTSDEDIVNKINSDYGIELEKTYYDGMSVQDVALGRCDLWPRAETSCNNTIKEVDNLKILGKTSILEVNAYPFSKNERGKEIKNLVNKALNEMRNDGTLKKLSEKWFDTDISEKPENAEELK